MNDHAQLEDKSRKENGRAPLPERSFLDTHVVDNLIEDEVHLSELGLSLEGVAYLHGIVTTDAVLVVVELDLGVVLELLVTSGLANSIEAEV
jgi:hypothetical protein